MGGFWQWVTLDHLSLFSVRPTTFVLLSVNLVSPTGESIVSFQQNIQKDWQGFFGEICLGSNYSIWGQHYIITVGLDRTWRGVLGLFRGFSDVSCQALISCYFLIAIQSLVGHQKSKLTTQPLSTMLERFLERLCCPSIVYLSSCCRLQGSSDGKEQCDS